MKIPTRSALLLCVLPLGVALASAGADTNAMAIIPFTVTRGHVMVPARVNDSEPLSFLLDTGYSITMIHPELTALLKLERVGEIAIVGIAGEEKASTFHGARFDLGGVSYSPRRVAALPSEGNRRRRRDGILGAELFRQFVVELDFRGKQLRLYAPTNFVYRGPGEVVPLALRRSIPTVSATILTSNREPITAQFEIDTGCDSALCLGHDFVETHKLLETDRTGVGGKVGVGGGANTRSGHVPQLQLGNMKIDRPQTDFFLEGSPVDRGLAGHIGVEALRQFKVIFDYSRRQMILEK